MTQISAKTSSNLNDRISQGDIFHDIDVVERIINKEKGIEVHYLHFPMVICMNQDCDLCSDIRDKQRGSSNANCRLLHIVVCPIFNFDSFKEGDHWGDIFDKGQKYSVPGKKGGTITQKIINNEDPRYHFLHFDDKAQLPDMIIDFKHFFTISTESMYQNISNRVFGVDLLYREKISQRFAYYLSRIALPD